MKIAIGTPAYAGSIQDAYRQSIDRVVAEASHYGAEVVVLTTEDSLVTRARNNIVAQFLADESLTHLFWIDGDIAFEPIQFWHVAMSTATKPGVLCGAYPFKQRFWPDRLDHIQPNELEAATLAYVFTLAADAAVPPDGWLEVLDAGTGFMCIPRAVFAELQAAFPLLKYQSDMIGVPDSGNHWLFFDTMVEQESGRRRYLSEDYAFCRRCQQAGIPIWINIHSRLWHYQGTHAFKGDLVTTLNVRDRLNHQPPAPPEFPVGVVNGEVVDLAPQRKTRRKK